MALLPSPPAPWSTSPSCEIPVIPSLRHCASFSGMGLELRGFCGRGGAREGTGVYGDSGEFLETDWRRRAVFRGLDGGIGRGTQDGRQSSQQSLFQRFSKVLRGMPSSRAASVTANGKAVVPDRGREQQLYAFVPTNGPETGPDGGSSPRARQGACASVHEGAMSRRAACGPPVHLQVRNPGW